ncbi:kinase-like domain-containing protein [Mycena vulgaris]|nr:kinase-like domain-containing protein [Mycena vulgaris]
MSTSTTTYICKPISSNTRFNKFLTFFNNNTKTNAIDKAIPTSCTANPQSAPAVPSVDDFDFLRLLGKGATAKVFLAQHRKSKELYALKVAPKANNTREIPLEQEMLQAIADGNSRFLLRLVASWHDTANYYLLTEWQQGGDLASQLLLERKFSKDRARIYLAQLILALEDLHARRILHRDVKPSNIFFDAEGNAVLGDLGFGKHFPISSDPEEPAYVDFAADPNATSGTFLWEDCVASERCGTPAFMSPEQHHGHPYSFDTDIWSLGMCFFFMLTGRSPFPGSPRTPDDFARASTFKTVEFKDEDGLDDEVQDVVLWLLAKNRRARTTLPEIKGHTFFAEMDWTALAAGTTPTLWKPRAPHVPRVPRPELITAGTPYTQGADPLPAFSFVHPEFIDKAPHPVRASPLTAWLGRVKERFTPKAKVPLVAQVVPTVVAQVAPPVVALVAPPVAAQVAAPPQPVSQPPVSVIEETSWIEYPSLSDYSRATSVSSTASLDEEEQLFSISLQRDLCKLIPEFLTSPPLPSFAAVLEEKPAPPAPTPSTAYSKPIPPVSDQAHRKSVLSGQHPHLRSSRGLQLLDWARSSLASKIARLDQC